MAGNKKGRDKGKRLDKGKGPELSARLEEVARRRLPPDTLDLIDDTKDEVVELRIGGSRGQVLSVAVNPVAFRAVMVTLMTVSGWAWVGWDAIRKQPTETAKVERTISTCRGLPPPGAE
jgi:hypothetical protein